MKIMADVNRERTLEPLATRIMELDYLIDKENQRDLTDTHAFVESMRNSNTERKTKGDIRKFLDFLTEDETTILFFLNEGNPKQIVARFFMNLRKPDGSEYEPQTLKSIQGSLNRYFHQNNMSVNIVEDLDFRHSREVLTSKRKLLRQQGKGNKMKRADPFTADEMNILYEGNQLGTANPRALINTMYVNNTLHFGMRSRLEHEKLKWGDIILKTSSIGEEYLEYTERATKTRTGATDESRDFIPKMFEDRGNQRCPVAAYKVYVGKRPLEMMTEDSPFYIGIKKMKSVDDSWFINQAMGKNTIGALVRNMCSAVGITGRKVNHSVRKTAITTLVHAGVNPSIVQQLSGHKNLSSINNYSTASCAQQKQMSSILTNLSTSMSTIRNATPSNPPDEPEKCRYSQEVIEEFLNDISSYEYDELQKRQSSPLSHGPAVMCSSDSTTSLSYSNLFPPRNILSGAHITGNVVFNFGRRVNCIDSESD